MSRAPTGASARGARTPACPRWRADSRRGCDSARARCRGPPHGGAQPKRATAGSARRRASSSASPARAIAPPWLRPVVPDLCRRDSDVASLGSSAHARLGDATGRACRTTNLRAARRCDLELVDLQRAHDLRKNRHSAREYGCALGAKPWQLQIFDTLGFGHGRRSPSRARRASRPSRRGRADARCRPRRARCPTTRSLDPSRGGETRRRRVAARGAPRAARGRSACD